jgi:hypothetical protein
MELTYKQMIDAFKAKIASVGGDRVFGNKNDHRFMRQQFANAIIKSVPSFEKYVIEFIDHGTVDGNNDIKIPVDASKMIAKYMLGVIAIIRCVPRLWTHRFLNLLTNEAATTVLKKKNFENNGENILLRFSSLLNSPDGNPVIILQSIKNDLEFKGSIKFIRESAKFSFDLEEIKIEPTDIKSVEGPEMEKVCVYNKTLQSKSLYAILELMLGYTGIAQVSNNLDVVVVEKNFKDPQKMMMSILTETPVELSAPQLSDPRVDVDGNSTTLTESFPVLKTVRERAIFGQ